MGESLPTSSARDLTERIWNAFPVNQPTFAKLLGLLDIEVSDAVPTAGVTLGANSRLLINPGFAEKHCQSDAALVMLVLHELWHVALGHTRLYERLTPAHNWAFDAIINAQLCRQFEDAEHTRLFRDLYAPDQFPWALLRPPPGWKTSAEAWLPGRAGEVHRALYSDVSVSMEELFRLLPTLDIGSGELMEGLLGSHDGVAPEAIAPEAMREIRHIVADWPMQEHPAHEPGGQTERHRISLAERREDAVRVLRHALMRLAGATTGNGQPRMDAHTVESVLPYGRDRKAWLREMSGGTVPIHRTDLAGPALSRREGVHVYLDVSGSMGGVIRPLYAALASVAPWLAPEVQLFSTQVVGIPIARLRQGDLITTQGTDIAVVTEHLIQNKVKRALIVTDGWVGDVPGEHVALLAKRRVHIEAVVTRNGSPNFIKALGWRYSHLPRLD